MALVLVVVWVRDPDTDAETGVKVSGAASRPTSRARLKFRVARALRNMPSRRREKALRSW